ncbi:hypothetical protein fugu_007666 [Takifugu bimaculatus]|uniref:Protein MGARP N-terminal domain-containing protein n=1 Tax=Takifugu bimaculatus TaxID=433685 RepID=A0A4Z2B0F5_9TELE|nr:hypothetical protein fugu_007666 [Takifugu bimaculatus]
MRERRLSSPPHTCVVYNTAAILAGAPVRLMASGLPGGSFNTTYFVLCGGGLTAALVYAYKTINSDTERYESRLAAAPAAEPAPAEVAEVIPESVSAPPEEAAEVSADPVVWSEEAAAEAVSEEPAEAPGTAAEASEGADAEGAAPPETPTAAHVGAGTAAVDGGAPPAAAEAAA